MIHAIPAMSGPDPTLATLARAVRAAVDPDRSDSYLFGISGAAILGPQAEEAAHWDRANIERVTALLGESERRHAAGIGAIRASIASPLTDTMAALDRMNAGDLAREIRGPRGIVAEAALARLVGLAPPDLDARLAGLWDQVPATPKELTDGPIHRQLLLALSHIQTSLATDAIGRAVRFAGTGDAVPHAIARWAAELYWARRGAAGIAVWLDALNSDIPHVSQLGLKYLGKTGDRTLLPHLAGRSGPTASYARVMLGDDSGWDELLEALRGPSSVAAARCLVDLAAAAHPRLLAALRTADGQALVSCAIVLSRTGAADALLPLETAAREHPELPRLAVAVTDLRRRLAR